MDAPLETTARDGEEPSQKGSFAASLRPGDALTGALPTVLPAWAARLDARRVVQAVRPSRTAFQSTLLHTPDIRKTIRAYAKTGAIGLRFQRQRAGRQPDRLAVLWDVSGSMAETIPLYFPWLYRLTNDLSDVGIYPIGIGVADITSELRTTYLRAVQHMMARQDMWESGTSLGTSLHSWIKTYGTLWLRPRSQVLVISDGWDKGNPEDIASALFRMRKSDVRITWMHPFLSSPGFELKTRALRAAKPYVDAWIAGGSARELSQVSMK